MIIGTNHFQSFEGAVSYYRDYGYSRKDVGTKRANGEISIGEPTIKRGDRLLLNKAENRYFIEVQS